MPALEESLPVPPVSRVRACQVVATLPRAWQAGTFAYRPPPLESQLVIYTDTIDADPDRAAAIFREPRPVEMTWKADSLLVLGLAWSLGAVQPQAWCGATYSWWNDPDRFPPLECADIRLLPPSAGVLELVLATREGDALAERHLQLSPRFAGTLIARIAIQRHANNDAGWLDQVTSQLVRYHNSPASLARSAVHRCTAADVP